MRHDLRQFAIGFVIGTLGGLSLMSGGGEAAAPLKVVISDLTYAPASITLKRGQSIEFVNEDFVDHTATDVSEGWDLSIAAGTTATKAFEREGIFPYYCRYHPGMTGTIKVVAN